MCVCVCVCRGEEGGGELSVTILYKDRVVYLSGWSLACI